MSLSNSSQTNLKYKITKIVIIYPDKKILANKSNDFRLYGKMLIFNFTLIFLQIHGKALYWDYLDDNLLVPCTCLEPD